MKTKAAGTHRALTLEDIAAIEPKNIPLGKIELRDDIQPRLKISEDAIGRYRMMLTSANEDGDPLPPIIVAEIEGEASGVDALLGTKRPKFTVVDGWHRFVAHQEAGRGFISARAIKTDLQQARWLAAQANLGHGVPLRKHDHREVFGRYIEARAYRDEDGSPRSYRDMVKDLGNIRSKSTLHQWMQQDFPRIAAEMAGRGEEAPEMTMGRGRESRRDQLLKNTMLELVRRARDLAKKDGRDVALSRLPWLLEGLGTILRTSHQHLYDEAKAAEGRLEEARKAAFGTDHGDDPPL